MEPIMTLVLILSLVVCAYMAWNIGANDVANAMGTSVGSRALTLKQAVIVAAVFEFAGAFLSIFELGVPKLGCGFSAGVALPSHLRPPRHEALRDRDVPFSRG